MIFCEKVFISFTPFNDNLGFIICRTSCFVLRITYHKNQPVGSDDTVSSNFYHQAAVTGKDPVCRDTGRNSPAILVWGREW